MDWEKEQNGKASEVTLETMCGGGAIKTALRCQGRGRVSVACHDSVSYHFLLQNEHLSI